MLEAITLQSIINKTMELNSFAIRPQLDLISGIKQSGEISSVCNITMTLTSIINLEEL